MKHLDSLMKFLRGKPSPYELMEVSDFNWRSIFDVSSSEWNLVEMDEKIKILKMLIENDYSIMVLMKAYQAYYFEENREIIAGDAENGIASILEHVLKIKWP